MRGVFVHESNNEQSQHRVSDAAEMESDWSSPGYQAFRILQVGFVAAPILAGLDKFFHLLVNWDQYVPGFVAQLSPIGVHELMFGKRHAEHHYQIGP